MTDYASLLKALQEADVEFIVIGGVAGIAHGIARFTKDVDVVYHRTDENHHRLVVSLENQNPYMRGAPKGLPFVWDVKTIQRGLNFTLDTDLGEIDLLGEIPGGDYNRLLPHTEDLVVYGLNCRCLTLEKLIEVKRAAGRPKDFEAIAELEVLLEERERLQEGE